MADLTAGVSKLGLNGTKAQSSKGKAAAPVADNWDDEDDSSGSDTEAPAAVSVKTRPSDVSKAAPAPGIAAPPPTPISPNYRGRPLSPVGPTLPPGTFPGSPDGSRTVEKPRPEKTDAVARRMIASALGVKVPRLTEEQRAYDKAMREKERKRRDEEKAKEKEREAEAAKARAAVWDD